MKDMENMKNNHAISKNNLIETTPLVSVNNLSVLTKDGATLVEPISLSLNAGKNLIILGETGSGKSLLAQAIMGALPDELIAEGQIEFSESMGGKVESLWGKHIAMLPQEPSRSLDPTMTVINQVWETGHFVAGMPNQQAREQATETLQALGLGKFVRYYPHQLSGGMAQRASFATATAGGATIVIADEPTKGLDEANKQIVIDLINKVSQQGGALLTITHDIDVARALSRQHKPTGDDTPLTDSKHQLMVMKQGEMLESGDALSLLKSPTSDYAQQLIAAAPHNWHANQKPELSHTALLSVDNITLTRGKGRGQRTLFTGVNFEMLTGEVVGVTGDSGIGKSSLGDALCGLLTPANGKIIWADEYKPAPKREKVLKLYQDPPSAFASHVPLLTLLNDVIRKHKLDASRIPQLLTNLKLNEDILSRTAVNVSGGELQRVAILRALLFDPILLIADEVTSRLDPITQKETLDLLIQQCNEIGCTVMMVCHDKHVIEHYCHKVIDLEQYRV